MSSGSRKRGCMEDLQMPSVGLVIPARNAGSSFSGLLAAIERKDLPLDGCLVTDTASSDGTGEKARAAGWEVLFIRKEEFGHGRTRQQAMEYLLRTRKLDIVVFLTQDVVIEDSSALRRLVLPLWKDAGAGAAYGRQLPHHGASVGAALLRAVNYPPESRRKIFSDRVKLGIRAPFLSNSFAAYRVAALQAVGGFPDVAICEDMAVGARMLMSGWAIRYEADACVHHSHEMVFADTWRRYRAIGRFHHQAPWLLKTFGRAEGAGLGLLRVQMSAALQERSLWMAFQFLVDDAIKYLAYRFH